MLLDRSTLTGESAPVEAGPTVVAAAGSVVRRGEAAGEVVATGVRTLFGRTASLVRDAQGHGQLQALVVTLVKAFLVVDGVLAALVLAASLWRGKPLLEVAEFVLMLLIASVPVALPAMFTLSSAAGSGELARKHVLVTRLAALEDLAGLDVLCTDKTGTLTSNRLSLVAVVAAPGRTDAEVVQWAALASDPATQDPSTSRSSPPRVLRCRRRPGSGLLPFDPAAKRAEARVLWDGVEQRVVKGAPAAVFALAAGPGLTDQVAPLAERGCRVLAVAAGSPDAMRVVGLVGLLDTPRPDSLRTLARLAELGIRVVMVTGDAAPTARAVAADVGTGRASGRTRRRTSRRSTCSRESRRRTSSASFGLSRGAATSWA